MLNAIDEEILRTRKRLRKTPEERVQQSEDSLRAKISAIQALRSVLTPGFDAVGEESFDKLKALNTPEGRFVKAKISKRVFEKLCEQLTDDIIEALRSNSTAALYFIELYFD